MPFIQKFIEADLLDQTWIFPLLNKPSQTALIILDLLSEKPLTYTELANSLQLHKHTIQQIVLALEGGGMVFKLNSQEWQVPMIGKKILKFNKKSINNLVP